MRKFLYILLLAGTAAALLTGCPGSTMKTQPAATTGASLTPTRKPAIYLYPTAKTEIAVSLQYNGRLTCTYPAYNGLWQVTAYPGGQIINRADGKEYSYLYWEGLTDIEYDLSRGFVIKGEDTAAFLQDKLSFLGLKANEYNEFIVYWLPQMQDNPYNLITFQSERYTDQAVLTINPRPDSMLRVFMVYQPLDRYLEIPEQILGQWQREGFAVVEWGGSCQNFH